MLMNRADTAALLGISRTTLDDWVRQGCPVAERSGRKGVEAKFETAEVIRWWIDRETAKAAKRADGADLDALRAEKIAVETQLKQLELAKERGLVAPLEQIEQAITKWSIEIRQGMRQIPQRVVTLLIGETDETRFKSVLLSEIDQTLDTLADADLVTESDLEGGTDED